MNLTLERYGSLPGIGTFGELHVAGRRFKTAEREWCDNMPFVSCIPVGGYILQPYNSPKYGRTLAMVNPEHDVYMFERDRKESTDRFACLIHAANYPDQVQGCIAIGRELTYINGKLGVTSSKASMETFRSLVVDGGEHVLQIRWRC
ncbi:MAG: DUF5675 family protein [Gammaproteobacteria bacterium]|nr:DUF5675 family protein [Gammaproteobacteria bacterium]MDH5802254.1 DUF5675 family protein [Gammaproteobacteria bacterium]